MRMNNIEILITSNNTKLTDIEWNVQQSMKSTQVAPHQSEQDLDNTRADGFDNTLASRQDGGQGATGMTVQGQGTMNMSMSPGFSKMPDQFSAKKVEFEFIPETKLWGAQAFV